MLGWASYLLSGLSVLLPIEHPTNSVNQFSIHELDSKTKQPPELDGTPLCELPVSKPTTEGPTMNPDESLPKQTVFSKESFDKFSDANNSLG